MCQNLNQAGAPLDWQTGLQAVNAPCRNRITFLNTRLIHHSADVDSNLRNEFPESHRWDYAICYDGQLYFIEYHEAVTGAVNDVIAKKNWLLSWIQHNYRALWEQMNGTKFYWIASGGTHILPNSPQSRTLSSSGIIVRSSIRIP